MWENFVERRRPQTTIWPMRIACCITKAINTRSENVILIAFSLQRLQERAHCYVIRILPVMFFLFLCHSVQQMQIKLE